MELLSLLAGQGDGAIPPGVVIRRCRVWVVVLVTLVLLALAAWAYQAVFSGSVTHVRGKTVIGLLVLPFVILWWAWNAVRALRFRRQGTFGWAVSDTHFLYVPPTGPKLGPIALTDITGLSLVKRPGPGLVVELTMAVRGEGAERPAQLHVVLRALGEEEIGLWAMRPSSSKELFSALQPKLAAKNPAAKIEDLGSL